MSVTDSMKQADYKYKKTHIKRIPLDVPIEFYNQIKVYCNDNGYSVNGFIKSAIQEKLNNAWYVYTYMI